MPTIEGKQAMFVGFCDGKAGASSCGAGAGAGHLEDPRGEREVDSML